MDDPVSPVRVAAYAWHQFFVHKPGSNSFYLVPDANHYLQNDRPVALAAALVHALDAEADRKPGPIEPALGSPVLVDVSREAMPRSEDVLRGSA
jgi:hypothetical protein